MTEPSDGDRLRQLEERLASMRKTQTPTTKKKADPYSQANMAWTMVTELVAGLGIGLGIGIGLDAVFGTRPWLLMLFTVLGFVAGVQTMMRTANEFQRKRQAAPAAEETNGSEDPPA